jgi:hypothetical protein
MEHSPIKERGADMNTMVVFYLGSSVLFGLAVILIRGTSPFSQIGSSTFDKRRNRRVVGTMLIVMAVLSFLIGVMAQMIST